MSLEFNYFIYIFVFKSNMNCNYHEVGVIRSRSNCKQKERKGLLTSFIILMNMETLYWRIYTVYKLLYMINISYTIKNHIKDCLGATE